MSGEATAAEATASEVKQDEVKDLDYYIAHPTEMPTDPDVLGALVQAQAEKAAAGGGEADPTKVDKPEGAAAATAEAKPEGVLTKDGKHVIPYAEMERRIGEESHKAGTAEAARKAAEDHANTLQRELEARTAELEALKAGGKPAASADTVSVSDDVKAKIREDYPTFAALFDAQEAQIKAATQAIAELKGRVQGAEKTREAEESAEVQSLIDSVPELSTWQKSTPYLFARAVEVERGLLAGTIELPKDSGFKDLKDLSERDTDRYALLVNIVKREIGLPSKSPEKTADVTKVDEVIAGASTAHPKSLSDLAGGSAAAASEVEALESVSPHVLASRLVGKSEEQIQQYLARL